MSAAQAMDCLEARVLSIPKVVLAPTVFQVVASVVKKVGGYQDFRC